MNKKILLRFIYLFLTSFFLLFIIRVESFDEIRYMNNYDWAYICVIASTCFSLYNIYTETNK